MFLEYSYHLDDSVFAFKGTLQVEFDYIDPYVGNVTSVDDFATNLDATADSAEIIDATGAVVGQVELLTDEQRARFGAAVLKDLRESIEEACVAEGQRWASVPA
jgi:hypothetical protein